MHWIALFFMLASSGWELHFRRGEALERQGEYAGAAREFEDALRETNRLPAGDWRLPLTLHNLGAVNRDLGQYADAERYYRRAISIWEKQSQREAELASSLQNLGSVYLILGRLTQAEPLYRRAYELRRMALGGNHPLTGASLHGLAELLHGQRRFQEAEELFRQASAVLQAATGLDSLEVADVSHNLAMLYRDTHRDTEARPLLASAVAAYEKRAPRHPKLAIVLRNLAELTAAEGDRQRTGELFVRSLGICDAVLPPDHPQTGIILQAYARFLEKSGRKKEARLAAERSRAILAKYTRDSGAGSTVDVSAFVGR
jgi:tetratricopeptide (TPR) repeat protein